MAFCIVMRENHPDRGIDEVIGPFQTREAADAEAGRCLAADKQCNNGRNRSTYDVWPMEAPLETE